LAERLPVPDIRIHRDHALGLAEARRLALRWAELAGQKFGMACSYEEGQESDTLSFARPGVDGELTVTAQSFALEARLGFLLGAFKDRIEGEIVRNLDALLAEASPLAATEQAAQRLKKKA
jgi:putative polyhydroxyalkanoate system protein